MTVQTSSECAAGFCRLMQWHQISSKACQNPRNPSASCCGWFSFFKGPSTASFGRRRVLMYAEMSLCWERLCGKTCQWAWRMNWWMTFSAQSNGESHLHNPHLGCKRCCLNQWTTSSVQSNGESYIHKPNLGANDYFEFVNDIQRAIKWWVILT